METVVGYFSIGLETEKNLSIS